MNDWLSDKELNGIFTAGLDQIAHFALQGFIRRGRGTVAVTPKCRAGHLGDAGYTLRYLRYDPAVSLPGPQTCRIIATYDPFCEFVVQYYRPGGAVRTLHMQSPSSPPVKRPATGFARIKMRLQAVLAFLI